METRVVSPPDQAVAPPTRLARPQSYALITIDSCIPVLGEVIKNISDLFDRCSQSLTADSYLNLCSKLGPATSMLLPNPHMSPGNRNLNAQLVTEDYMWETVLTAALGHVKPTLAQGLPQAMEELDQRDIVPILVTHRNQSLFRIVIDTLSSSDQATIKGLFPTNRRLSSSSVNSGSHLFDDILVYSCLDQTPYGGKGHRSFAIEVSPLGTRCATANGIETIAYDLLTRGNQIITQASKALTASGACAVIRHWRELNQTLEKTICYPIPKPAPHVH